MTDLLYSLTGFGIGLLVGMTGLGGGSLLTPLLILLFGIHPATAVGTDLLYSAATKTAGSVVHGLTDHPVPCSGDQCEWYGMGDIRPDDSAHRQLWVQDD